MCVTLTVFFDDPFYAGLFERREGGELRAARVVFGAEPSDAEVWAWVLEHYAEIVFSPPVEGGRPPRAAANPKRRQRQAAHAGGGSGAGTRAQPALSLLREQNGKARDERRCERREREAARRRLLRVEKRKARHRGR